MRFLPVLLPLALIALPFLSRDAGARKYLTLQQPAAEGLKPLDFAPFGYFDQKCARCHGLEGSNYGDVLKGKDDARLHDGIDAMAKGPGQAPLEEPQIQVLTAWHRALADGVPFAHLMAVAKPEGGKTILSGEATPDAKVTLQSGEKSFEAQRDGVRWTIEAPADVDLAAAKLSAEK